jgi:branched-subunit amino acid transport protein AzlD
MTISQQIISIVIAAVATMATRFLPFLIFNRSNSMSPYLEQLGRFLPAALMGVLVVYCYRHFSLLDPTKGIIALLAGLLTLGLHLWKGNMPLSILVGTGTYIVLLHCFG